MEKIYKGEIQRLFPILEAIKEGKTIQWNDMGVWCDIDGDDEGFVLDTLIGKPDGYRIKPEPTYRPFKNAEECWQELLKHQPFGVVKDKYFANYQTHRAFTCLVTKSTEEIVELIKPTVNVIDVIKPIYNFKAKL